MSHEPDSGANLDAEVSASATTGSVGERWNYQVFVIQGIVANASKRIGSARLLLPYLYVATGSPVFLAGALMPIVSIARLIGQFIAAPIVSNSHTKKWFLFLGWMATAVGLAAAGLSARIPDHWIVMAIFVLAALAMGLAKGLNALAFNDLMSLNISKSRRNSGVFFMSAAAGVVTIAVTWGTHLLSSNSDDIGHYINLALSAAFVTALAGCIILLFQEKKSQALHESKKKIERINYLTSLGSLREVLRHSWFRRYLVMRCWTATVILAMPFFAVHGATHHVQKHSGALSAFVIATSVAVIIFGPIWKALGERSQRLPMALGSALVGVAGIWALVLEQTTALQTVFAHSFVFALAAAGIQAVNGSRMLFLIDAASKDELAYYVAVSNTISAILAIIVASLFGYIAQFQGVVWPVLLITALNFIAAAHAMTLSRPMR